jgi:hypothetical protein
VHAPDFATTLENRRRPPTRKTSHIRSRFAVSAVSPVHFALAGIRANLRTFEATAERLSRIAPGGDPDGDLLTLQVAKCGVEANVAAARTADELVGSLLDAPA